RSGRQGAAGRGSPFPGACRASRLPAGARFRSPRGTCLPAAVRPPGRAAGQVQHLERDATDVQPEGSAWLMTADRTRSSAARLAPFFVLFAWLAGASPALAELRID